MLENERRGERRKQRKNERRKQIVRDMNFQAETASLLHSSSLSRSLTALAYFAIRDIGEWRLLENERRGGKKEEKKEGKERTDFKTHKKGTFKLRQHLCCATLAPRDLSPGLAVSQ